MSRREDQRELLNIAKSYDRLAELAVGTKIVGE
jgi:hypothetical protein